MSMVICARCDKPIDTDDDVDAWTPYFSCGGAWVCKSCREILGLPDFNDDKTEDLFDA